MRQNNKEKLHRKLAPKSFRRTPWFYLLLVGLLGLLAIGLYQIPIVQDYAYYYYANTKAKVFYYFNPPAAKAFNPSEQGTQPVNSGRTLTAMPPTHTPTPTSNLTSVITSTPTQTPVPTLTPTPIPGKVILEGIKWERQGFNNCGPTTLAMNLSYWGWQGDQHVTEKVLKPRKEDRNVMPYEMLDYVTNETELYGIVRYGGNLELVKKLVAAGFPVLIERGYMNASDGWMGHYGLIKGYDDAEQVVYIPDAYLGEIKIRYEDIAKDWDQFDDIYLVIYSIDRQDEVYNILGPQLDDAYNKQYALDQVNERLESLEGLDLFFAWYSRGSIQVQMNDFYGASQSFDKAFEIYQTLKEADRPWRITWYQTGPYYAYYYTGRYHDVVTLAQQTLDITPEDAIPETWVWAGRAAVMLGQRETAIYYFQQALVWHPNWWVAQNELSALGVPID